MALAMLGCWPVQAEEAQALTVAKIISGDEFWLSDGRDVHLQGIKAPAADTPELEKQARDKLQELTKDRPLLLSNSVIDRYGRSNAQVYVVSESHLKTGLQIEMLKAGLAFVYPPVGNEPDLADMQITEKQARLAKRGIWGNDAYADLPAVENEDIRYGEFAFVSGKVTKAERVKNKFYLNFGDDWRKDFTVAIAAHDLKFFRKQDIDPADYEGKTIRVRGWVMRDFGPMIEVTSPAQIEIVAAGAK